MAQTQRMINIYQLQGLVLLTFQAQFSSLQPPINTRPSRSQTILLYTGLYSMATGVGGVKASLPAHGADQLDHTNQRLISAFFNWFFFSLCTGGLIAATVMVWIEENKGWNWSFKISIIALSLALCIFAIGFPIYRHKRPVGSALTRVFKVKALDSSWCTGSPFHHYTVVLNYSKWHVNFFALVVKVLASAVRNRKASVVEMGNHNAISAEKGTPDKFR